MLFNIFAVVGSASIDENNLCEHHTEHTKECGYVEGESERTYSCEECTVIIKPTIASGTSEWTTNPEPEMVSVTSIPVMILPGIQMILQPKRFTLMMLMTLWVL